MPTIKITDDRQGATFRTGINGRFFDLPLNSEIEVSEEMRDHLRSNGVRFDETDTARASASKEGSGDALARPIGPHDVISAGTAVKSLNDRPLAGDQPGDVTDGGGGSAEVRFNDVAGFHGNMIAEDADASDARVVAERVAPKDAPVAQLAGEGESGTPKAKTQGVDPSHEDAAPKAKTNKK